MSMGYTNGEAANDTRRVFDAIFRALASESRRAILRQLSDRSPREIQDILPPDDGAQSHDTAIHFHHVHLPCLREASLIRDRGDRIGRTGHPIWNSAAFHELLGRSETSHPDAFGAFTHPLCRATSYVLTQRSSRMTRAELARELPEVLPEHADDPFLAVRLHHVHLPMLDAAGVIDYDANEALVSYNDNPLVPLVVDVLRDIG